jgi:hypothetical protein
VILAADRAGILRHVRCLERFIIVKNGRIKTAVVVGISLDEELIGEQLATVTQQNFKNVAVRATARPDSVSRLQIRCHPEAQYQQGDQQQ